MPNENEVLKNQLEFLREHERLMFAEKHLTEKLEIARGQLKKAMELLGDVENPDFNNKLVSLRYQVSLLTLKE